MTKAKKAASASKAPDAGTDDDAALLHPDDWKAGLRIGIGTLNTRTVKRADKDFHQVLPVCLAHNLRDGNEAHRHRGLIHKNRKHLNTVLIGPDRLAVAAELVRNTFDELDIRPWRQDQIAGIELVAQPPADLDRPEFWDACIELARRWYPHVISAVVHRDQKRPHMHLIALAIADGRLCGNELASGANQFEVRQAEFMRLMRDRFGIRPDRPAKTYTAIMTGTGKGAKTHAAAARRDAALLDNSLAHELPSPGNSLAHQLPSPQLPSPNSILRSVSLLHREGVERGLFAPFAVGEVACVPRPFERPPTPAKTAPLALHGDIAGPDAKPPAKPPFVACAAARAIGAAARSDAVAHAGGPATKPRTAKYGRIPPRPDPGPRPRTPLFSASTQSQSAMNSARSDDERLLLACQFALSERASKAARARGRVMTSAEREKAIYAARRGLVALARGKPVQWWAVSESLSKDGAHWLTEDAPAPRVGHG